MKPCTTTQLDMWFVISNPQSSSILPHSSTTEFLRNLSQSQFISVSWECDCCFCCKQAFSLLCQNILNSSLASCLYRTVVGTTTCLRCVASLLQVLLLLFNLWMQSMLTKYVSTLNKLSLLRITAQDETSFIHILVCPQRDDKGHAAGLNYEKGTFNF